MIIREYKNKNLHIKLEKEDDTEYVTDDLIAQLTLLDVYDISDYYSLGSYAMQFDIYNIRTNTYYSISSCDIEDLKMGSTVILTPNIQLKNYYSEDEEARDYVYNNYGIELQK